MNEPILHHILRKIFSEICGLFFTDIWWKWITPSQVGYPEQNKYGGLCNWHSEAAVSKRGSSRG